MFTGKMRPSEIRRLPTCLIPNNGKELDRTKMTTRSSFNHYTNFKKLEEISFVLLYLCTYVFPYSCHQHLYFGNV